MTIRNHFSLSAVGYFATIVTLTLSLPPAQAEPSRWAILIGVNDYTELTDLQFCSNDMKALRDQLVASGFPKDQVFLLHDDAKDRKYLPFRNNIEKQLELVLGLLNRGDLVVVGFSGHGIHRNGESWLCPSDADLENPDSTMVSLKTVYDRLNDSQGALKLMMVDACRNDPNPLGRKSAKTAKEVNRGFAQELQRPPHGILLMTSCAPGEISMEDENFGHGVFMHFVLEGLKGRADLDKSGAVSLSELWNFTNRQTKLHVARRYNDSQRPGFEGRLSDDFDISTIMNVALEESITNSIGMELKPIPAGEFMMGSGVSADALARRFDMKAKYFVEEHPQHRVRITKPFYLQSTEVTQEQWKLVMGTEPWNGEKYVKEGRDYAASYVSWDDAVSFCERLSALEGATYRLPTEAEWEYACRAGSTSIYSFGDSEGQLANYAWFDVNAEDRDEQCAHRVGLKRANAWGLHDMHGNVWEWCQDWYGKDYYAKSTANDPGGPSSGSSRVLRGGSWYDVPCSVRSSARYRVTADVRFNMGGFRVVLLSE